MANIPCICPPRADGQMQHPGGDEIILRPKLDLRSTITARNAIAIAKSEDEDISVPEILAVLTEHYCLLGIESWTLKDADGKPVPVTRAAIRQFLDEHIDEAMIVGDEGDELYAEAVMRPLIRAASDSLQPTPIEPEISPMNGSTSSLPEPLRLSSTSTSPMDDTEMMVSSQGGASN